MIASFAALERTLGSLALLVVISLGLVSCAAPVNPSLWNPRPQIVEVTEDLEFDHQGVGRFFVPRGEYVYWYSNKFGYFYANNATMIRCTYKPVLGAAKEESFKGGIWLSNRVDAVLIYELSTVAADARKTGELAHLAAWEAGDKDGLARNWRGEIPLHLRTKLVFK